jgi:hypothetical protein
VDGGDVIGAPAVVQFLPQLEHLVVGPGLSVRVWSGEVVVRDALLAVALQPCPWPASCPGRFVAVPAKVTGWAYAAPF